MNIVVNGRFLSRRPTGVDRFALELVSAIDRLLSEDVQLRKNFDVRLLVPPDAKEFNGLGCVVSQCVGERVGQWWEQLDFPVAVDGNCLILSLCNTGPVFTRNQVLVIHDAATSAMPQAFSMKFRYWYRVLMPVLGILSRKVLTVSAFSAEQIALRFRIPPRKIDVIVEGGEHILRVPPDDQAVARFGLSKRPFVLAVSSMAAHKNFQLVLDAVGRLDDPPFDIAIAGGANARVFGTAGNVTSDRIKWLGYVSDAELRALYESAMCFVFPSLYEGFGIPPLEAMNCGCPVLAARAASIPEVCGDAALYFDPRSPEELAELLTRVAVNQELRADLASRGRVQAAKFSWDKAARQVLAACKEAMR